MNKFLSEWNNWQLVVALGFVLLCAVGAGAVESDYFLQVMVLAAVYAAIGTAWSIAGGLSGLLLLGYISFFGMGAYIDGVFFTKMGLNPWLCIVLSFFSAALLAWAISLVTLRFGLGEDYFAMFTVALSQVLEGGQLREGSMWVVPQTYHDPIRQDAVLLRRGADNAAARALLQLLQSPKGRDLIRSFGYAL